jgi:hypothetical protein
MHLNLPRSERQLWRIYLTDHLGNPPPNYNPDIRIKFTTKSKVYRVLYRGKLVATADYSTTPPEIQHADR